MTPEQKEKLRALPAVSELLGSDVVEHWLESASRTTVVRAIQHVLDQVRNAILDGDTDPPLDAASLLLLAEDWLWEQLTPFVRRVVNATGIVLHTGLGRAPLCDAAIDAVADAAAGYCDLEYNLDSGTRGRRVAGVAQLLCERTGAEAATVVNNNAAATLLIAQTFARDREVIVSRGQLIEIGDSYRLPAILAASGATLREVGTTNRTHRSDYEQAINDRTAILLRVHASNYRVIGFTAETPMDEIAELAHRFGLLAVDDLGSGALFDLAQIGLPAEPWAGDSLAAGADLVCFSGDKLLGGPQAGIILGRADLIERLHASPMMRCFRVGKLTLLALEATLRHYEDIDEARDNVPALTMLAEPTESLANRARALCGMLDKTVPDESFYVGSDVSFAGGGSLPARELPTVVVQWRPSRRPVETVTAALRQAEVPVIARVREDAVCFDLRTIREPDYEDLAAAVASAACHDEGRTNPGGRPSE